MTTGPDLPRGAEPPQRLAVTFQALPPGAWPGFVMKVTVTGGWFPARGMPLLARLGGQELRAVAVAPSGTGFMGLLEHLPHDGDRLAFGYGRAGSPTDLVYRSQTA